MTQQSTTKPWMTSIIVLLALLGLAGVIGIWYWLGYVEPLNRAENGLDAASAGPIGDMFGGVNALFSAMAFLGVIVTLLLQMRELRLQRQEIQKSSEAQQAQASAQNRLVEATELLTLAQTINGLAVAEQVSARGQGGNVGHLKDLAALLTAHIGPRHSFFDKSQMSESLKEWLDEREVPN